MHRSLIGVRTAALAVAAAFIAAGCSSDSTGPGTAPAALAFIVGPSNATAGEAIAPAIQVELRDAGGQRIPNATNSVTLTLASNPGDATLLGTLTVSAQEGVATFTDVRLERAAAGYTLLALVGQQVTTTSSPFEIQPAAPARAAFVDFPDEIEVRETIPDVVVEIQDEFGNRVTGASNAVTLSLAENPGRMIFHASGISVGNRFLSLVDPITPEVLPPLANTQDGEVLGLAYHAESGMVYGTNRAQNLNTFDPATGLQTIIDDMELYLKAVAFEDGDGGRLLGVSPFDPEVYEIDLETAGSTLLGALNLPGDSVEGATAMAADPTTGTMYVALILDSEPNRRIRTLATLNLTTFGATAVAELSEDGVAGFSFLPDGRLLAVTGDGATNPERLWELDKATGEMTEIIELGIGNDGESITTVPALLSGMLTRVASGGAATFNDLEINAPASGYVLRATVGALEPGTSPAFDVQVPEP